LFADDGDARTSAMRAGAVPQWEGMADGYGSVPSLRSSMIAALRQRVVSGEKGSVNGMPFALRSGFPSRSTR
jgi:hypothetical protein